MSVIVVVKKNDKAVIAADMMYSFGGTKVQSKYLRNQSKIYSFAETYIGTIGATAHENVLQHLFERHKNKISFNNKEEIFDSYLKIHPILKEQYFLNTEEGENDEYESSQIDGLIANQNGIFGIYSWREVYEFEQFWAIGSGQDYALGAMYAVYNSINESEDIAEVAVKAACEFDDGCGLPVTIHSVKLSKSVLE
jgi:ATP-dependent HslUV protease, peptidase subunit HslV